ncbi:MAG: hypothetical protein M3Q07_23080 [Pseudobdellovibrionaceae bacterium]|nr:hypothetical protein [Pseudobdellovibrionaceae bacterium]
MGLQRQLILVLVLGLQACGKEKETKVIDNPDLSLENIELKNRVSELEKELEGKLQLSEDNVKLEAEIAASTDAKQKQEQLLRFAQARNLVKPSDLLSALDQAISNNQDTEKKAKLEELKNFYKSILPEGGNIDLYCSKLIDQAVERGLLTHDQGRDFRLEGSAPVFVKPGDINSKLVGVAPCWVVYNSLFE